jgi:hypothetical protein
VLAELASAIDHASPMLAARAHADARASGGSVGGAAGGITRCSTMRTKREQIIRELPVHAKYNILMCNTECTLGLASHAPLARVLERLPSA